MADQTRSMRINVQVTGLDDINRLNDVFAKLRTEAAGATRPTRAPRAREADRTWAERLGSQLGDKAGDVVYGTIKTPFASVRTAAGMAVRGITSVVGPLGKLATASVASAATLGAAAVAVVAIGIPIFNLAATLKILRTSFRWVQEGSERQLRILARAKRTFPGAVGDALRAGEARVSQKLGIASAILGEGVEELGDRINQRFSEVRMGRGLRGDRDIFARWGITPGAVQTFERARGGERIDVTDYLYLFLRKRDELNTRLAATTEGTSEWRSIIARRKLLYDDSLKLFNQKFADAVNVWTEEDWKRLSATLDKSRPLGEGTPGADLDQNARDFVVEFATTQDIFKRLKKGIQGDVQPALTQMMDGIRDYMTEPDQEGRVMGRSLRGLASALATHTWETMEELIRGVKPEDVEYWIDIIKNQWKPEETIKNLGKAVPAMKLFIKAIVGITEFFFKQRPIPQWGRRARQFLGGGAAAEEARRAAAEAEGGLVGRIAGRGYAPGGGGYLGGGGPGGGSAGGGPTYAGPTAQQVAAQRAITKAPGGVAPRYGSPEYQQWSQTPEFQQWTQQAPDYQAWQREVERKGPAKRLGPARFIRPGYAPPTPEAPPALPARGAGAGPGPGPQKYGTTGHLIPKHMQTADVLGALNEVAARHGIHPDAIAAVIKVESNWNPRTATGSYRGLTQIHPTYGPKGATRPDIMQLTPAEQIRHYGNWLEAYKFQQQAQKYGVDFKTMTPAQQAAYLQGFQFAPNKVFERYSKGQRATRAQQARVLGGTTYAEHERYFSSILGKPIDAPEVQASAQAALAGEGAVGPGAVVQAPQGGPPPTALPSPTAAAGQAGRPNVIRYPGAERFGTTTQAAAAKQEAKAIVMHVTGHQTIQKQGEWQRTNRDQLGYHFVIDKDGSIYQFGDPSSSRPNAMQSSKYRSARLDLTNRNAISVGFITGGRQPTEAQLAASDQLVPELQKTYNLGQGEVFGHGELQGYDPNRNRLGPGKTPEGAVMARRYRAGGGAAVAAGPQPTPVQEAATAPPAVVAPVEERGGRGGRVVEKQSKTARDRRLALNPETRKQLEFAAAQTGLEVHVTSGGQEYIPGRRGTTVPGRATGSERHTYGNAADFNLWDPVQKRYLSPSTNAADAARAEEYTRQAVRAGATGVGAGYMTDRDKIHIGGGSVAEWGKGQAGAYTRRGWQRGLKERASKQEIDAVLAKAKEEAPPPSGPTVVTATEQPREREEFKTRREKFGEGIIPDDVSERTEKRMAEKEEDEAKESVKRREQLTEPVSFKARARASRRRAMAEGKTAGDAAAKSFKEGIKDTKIPIKGLKKEEEEAKERDKTAEEKEKEAA